MKLIGMILLLLTGLIGGCSAAEKLRHRAANLLLIRQCIQTMINELRFQLPLTSDLLQDLSRNPAFASLTFLQTAAGHAARFPDCWFSAIEQDPALSQDERAVLKTIGQTLGSTTLEGQLDVFAICLERLHDLQRDAERKASEKGNLYRSLGLLSAVFFVFIP